MGYPAKYKIKTRQGQTYRRVFTWTIDSEPVDLTGYIARMQVRRRPNAASPVILDVTDDITIDAEEGQLEVMIPASVLAAIPPDTYVYDLELDNAGTVTTLIAGSFQVDPEVTR